MLSPLNVYRTALGKELDEAVADMVQAGVRVV